jgi:hypothetical protein
MKTMSKVLKKECSRLDAAWEMMPKNWQIVDLTLQLSIYRQRPSLGVKADFQGLRCAILQLICSQHPAIGMVRLI